MSEKQQTSAPATGEPGQAVGGQVAGAAAGGLDLSLGHVGTHQAELRWIAVCDACHYTYGDQQYHAAEAAAGHDRDPLCPRCARMAWTFFPES